MLASLAFAIARHARTVVITWIVAAIAMVGLALGGVDGEGVFDRLESGAPGVKGSESAQVRERQQAAVPADDGPSIWALYRGVDVTDPDTANITRDAIADMAASTGVRWIASPFGIAAGEDFTADPAGGGGDARDLVAEGANGFLVQIHMRTLDTDQSLLTVHQGLEAQLEDLGRQLSADHSEVSMLAYSDPLLFDEFTSQMRRDLLTGEAIALPLAFIVMVLVFGGFLAAGVPLVGALVSIASGLLILYGFSYPLDIDESAVNVVLVLAIGLSVDYGLLIMSRYREELSAHDATDRATHAPALADTLTTAGRTVFFSALTIAIAVGGMITFEPSILRGIGAAALGAVTMAMVAALTLIPALAYLWAPRIVRGSFLARVPGMRRLVRSTSDVERDHGAFSTLAGRVQRHPWLTLGATTALLLVLASPVLGIQMRNSQAELLPADNERREFLEAIPVDYPALATPTATVVAEATPEQLDAWAADALTRVDAVIRVTPAGPLGPDSAVGVFLDVDDPAGADAVEAVQAIRALDAPFDILVGGQVANQIDFVDSIVRGAPLAVGIVVAVTFVLLFLMTGSLLVPAKALVINTLSLAATLGILTWVFQEGNLEGPLGFDSTGGLETYVVVMIVAFGFGLAMDYDLFLLARVKELVDRGVGNNEAVRIGLQRSGRIITSAAAVIILVFMGFAFGELLVIKQVGFGLAVAVLLDATVVRMLLVPATMTLLGRWNWWAPGPLRQLYERFQLTH